MICTEFYSAGADLPALHFEGFLLYKAAVSGDLLGLTHVQDNDANYFGNYGRLDARQ